MVVIVVTAAVILVGNPAIVAVENIMLRNTLKLEEVNPTQAFLIYQMETLGGYNPLPMYAMKLIYHKKRAFFNALFLFFYLLFTLYFPSRKDGFFL